MYACLGGKSMRLCLWSLVLALSLHVYISYIAARKSAVKVLIIPEKTTFTYTTSNSTITGHSFPVTQTNSESIPKKSPFYAKHIHGHVGYNGTAWYEPAEVIRPLGHNVYGKSESCSEYPWQRTDKKFILMDDNTDYFIHKAGLACFTEGTIANDGKVCHCSKGWHGNQCSIPDSVWYSNLPRNAFFKLKPRTRKFRRIIHGFPLNIEFDLLDARLAMLADVVDVFLILESNYTAYGNPKPLRFLEKLQHGSYKNYSCKIVYVKLDFFPEAAYGDGWVADDLHRNHLAQQGLMKQVHGYRPDDIFLLTDADELPSRETVLFLKLHDGYPEPVGHTYVSTVYGFFWSTPQPVAIRVSALSIDVLSRILDMKAIKIRSGPNYMINKAPNKLNTYLKSHPKAIIKLWLFGNSTHPSGWHCSWCLTPQGVHNKLVSAQNGDFPRWGDYPEKQNISYLKDLICYGHWFDGKTNFSRQAISSPQYCPQFFLDNFKHYKHILENPCHLEQTNINTVKF